jgi:hypothetical protein
MTDEAYVAEPYTQEAARRVLDAAVAAGYDEHVVRTGDDGYYVPADVVDKLYPPKRATAKPTEEGQS